MTDLTNLVAIRIVVTIPTLKQERLRIASRPAGACTFSMYTSLAQHDVHVKHMIPHGIEVLVDALGRHHLVATNDLDERIAESIRVNSRQFLASNH